MPWSDENLYIFPAGTTEGEALFLRRQIQIMTAISRLEHRVEEIDQHILDYFERIDQAQTREVGR